MTSRGQISLALHPFPFWAGWHSQPCCSGVRVRPCLKAKGEQEQLPPAPLTALREGRDGEINESLTETMKTAILFIYQGRKV